ncbi:MAG: DEAD/DEAH box helicase [Bacteroidetes bacterium]|nr:DEAD/DEAH box helicase [Bacteroidota bacterium]
MNENNLHIYQSFAVDHVLQHDHSALLLGLGLGKTVVTLTAVNRLLYEDFEVKKVLIIAPKRVAEHTWTTEAAKWEHLKHLQISKVIGSETERKKALKAKADIFVINRENVAWLVSHLAGAWPFDMVVIDELSSFKSAKSIRFKALRQVRPRMNRVVGLTGTPVPNGLLDLWPQMYLLDQGERLGKTLTGYRDKYFKPGRRNGYVVYDYERNKGDDLLGEDIFEKEIYDKISDICISMKAEDWLQLPKRIDHTAEIILPAEILNQYHEFEKRMVLELANEREITALNAAGLTNKLLQFANGAVYNEDGGYYEIHNEKIEALAERIEAANGHPVLCFYQFKSDVERIKKYLKAFKPYQLQSSGDIDAWNKKRIPFLLAHAASAGHGLNMQQGGNLMEWFGAPWSLELYEQAVARLDRQGQMEAVVNNRLAVKGTMDYDVLAALSGKARGQDALMNAVRAIVSKYRN